MTRICIIGISGKLGQYMTQHALDRGFDVVGVCRPESVAKLDRFKGRIRLYPGRTDDASVVAQAVAGCDGVLTVLAPWGFTNYASGTARAVLHSAEPGARLIFSCGWHISKDGKDRYSLRQRFIYALFTFLGWATRMADISDQVRATKMIFGSDTDWTVVRGSDLKEGESEGLPVWAPYVGDPVLASNRTRRTDFALFMVHALTDDRLIHEAPAIVSRQSASARTHAMEEAVSVGE
ncbi:MAG TPA: short-chain dehydrogenase [Rhodobacteraceae bacterium]|nr:short-chain dehydrogenase [Paracoccaceae bacterium]